MGVVLHNKSQDTPIFILTPKIARFREK